MMLQKAIELRSSGRAEEAYALIKVLLQNTPDDAFTNYLMAWTCDNLGYETEAVPYYEKALQLGLQDDDLRGALLGLGSTYRCLGDYQKSLNCFERGEQKFPHHKEFQVFKAMTLFNLGQHEESMRLLMTQLAETSSDKNIQSYRKAILFYSDKLTQRFD